MITAEFVVVDMEGHEHSRFEMPFVNEKAMRTYLDSRSNHPYLLVQLVDFTEENNE